MPVRQKILVTGGNGMLGTDLVQCLVRHGHDVVSPNQIDCDITHMPHIVKLTKEVWGRFDWIVNCAAYTAVDKAEQEFAAAQAVNGIAAGALAAVASGMGARMIQVSTDFVFDGEAAFPYTEDITPNPLGAYGKSKLFGERQVMAQCPNAIIARTSWLFGPNGNSFPKTMIEAWKAGKNLRVVGDQMGCPTYTGDLSEMIAAMIATGPAAGIYHTCGEEGTTWFEFAVKVLESYRAMRAPEMPEVKVEQIATSDWPTPAKRPKYSVMSTDKVKALGIPSMRPLELTIPEFISRLEPGPEQSVLPSDSSIQSTQP